MEGAEAKTITEAYEIERCLEVGAAALLHSAPNRKDGPRYKTCIRGWQAGSYVMHDLPPGDELVMTRNQPCVIRFVAKGNACGFDARVLAWGNQLNPFFRVTWPAQIERMAIRKHDRVQLRVPCTVKGPDGKTMEAELRDVSAGGIGIQLTDPLAQDAPLTVSFLLPDGAAIRDIACVVRSAKPDQDGAYHGCQFGEGHEDSKNAIEFFVSTTLERADGGRPGGRRVLFVEPNANQIAALREVLAGHDVQVATAATVVDGFFRLRMVSPGVLLINYDQPGLDGIAVGKIIKGTPGLHVPPVILYGGEGPDIEKRAKEAGLDHYFASVVMTEQLAGQILKYLNNEPALDAELA